MTIEDISKLSVDKILRDNNLKNELHRVYKELFNDELVIGCPSCVDDALFRIRYYLRNKTNKKLIMEESKTKLFALRPNIVLWVGQWFMHLTNDNLTDDLAVKLLKKNAAHIKNFEKYPDNWKELVSGESKIVIKKEQDSSVVEEKIVEKQLTVDQILSLYRKDQIVDLINEITPNSFDHDTSKRKYELAQILIDLKKAAV